MASSKRVNFRLTATDDTGPGLRSVRRRFADLGRSLKANALRLAGGALATGIVVAGAAAAKLAEQFDNIAKSARALALSPTFVRQIQQVAELVGVAENSFARFLTRLRDDTDKTNRALRELGINVEVFRELGGEQQLLTVVRQMELLSSQADKTAAAVELFGDRLAREFLLLANTGSAAIERELAGALESGAAVAERLAAPSEGLRDAVARARQGINNDAASILASFNEWGQALIDNIFLADKWTSTALNAIDKTTAGVKALENQMVAVNDQTNNAITNFRRVTAESVGRAGKVADEIDNVFRTLNEGTEQAAAVAQQNFSAIISNVDILLNKLQAERNRRDQVGESFDARTDRRTSFTPAGRGETALLGLKAQAEAIKQTKALQELVRLSNLNSGSTFN